MQGYTLVPQMDNMGADEGSGINVFTPGARKHPSLPYTWLRVLELWTTAVSNQQRLLWVTSDNTQVLWHQTTHARVTGQFCDSCTCWFAEVGFFIA